MLKRLFRRRSASHRRRQGFACAFAVVLLISTSQAQAQDLRAQLKDLSRAHGFTIKGLQRLADAPARQVDGDLDERLGELLDGFGHVLVRDGSGRIQEVLIAGENASTSESARGFRAKVQRRGGGRLVQALLIGRGMQRHTPLFIDTGATNVVLPMSMVTKLGLKPEDLRDGWSQTANGRVKGKHARLRAVRVGNAEVENVAVTFLLDRQLGGNKLLGMSFLEHFRFTFDDQGGELVLHPR